MLYFSKSSLFEGLAKTNVTSTTKSDVKKSKAQYVIRHGADLMEDLVGVFIRIESQQVCASAVHYRHGSAGIRNCAH